MTDLIAIVPSAGLGRRFDPSKRKTFVNVGETPLLVHTLKRLHREQLIKEIIPVLREDDIDMGKRMAREYGLHKISRIAPGGKERQDSIYNALKMIGQDGRGSGSCCVLIHDGVRPFIPEGMIEGLVTGLNGVDGVVPGIPVKDTIKEVDDQGIVLSTLDRDRMRAVQTPQFFSFRAIKDAYDRAIAEGFYATDDAALVERAGGRIRIIEGSQYNIKVTTPEDLGMVEYVLARQQDSP